MTTTNSRHPRPSHWDTGPGPTRRRLTSLRPMSPTVTRDRSESSQRGVPPGPGCRQFRRGHRSQRTDDRATRQTTRLCPRCGETLGSDAGICPNCDRTPNPSSGRTESNRSVIQSQLQGTVQIVEGVHHTPLSPAGSPVWSRSSENPVQDSEWADHRVRDVGENEVALVVAVVYVQDG
jgi:hypothetical protein